MKKEFSIKWVGSTQPRKQRKYRYNAPLHARGKMLNATLSKSLRTEFGKKSLRVRTGDDVKVMRGSFKGRTGTVDKIDTKKLKIYVDGINVKKANQQDVVVAIDPSNLMLIKLNFDDKKRKKVVARVKPEAKAVKETKTVKTKESKKTDTKTVSKTKNKEVSSQ